MVVSIKVTGLPQLRRFLNKKENAVEMGTVTGMTKAVFHVQNEVKMSIAGRKPEPRSVDTGRFLNSTETNVSKFDGRIFSNLPYGKFLEFGTSKLTGRHHFHNTKKREKGNIKKILQKAISAKL